jgi:hypothetical protein
MTRTRASEIARGTGAVVLLTAIVVGPPLLLARLIGWPLPSSVNLGDIQDALGGATISDEVLLKALAVACWLAWAYTLTCVVAESLAWRRGRVARAIPLGGFVQPILGRLVVAVGLLAATVRPPAPGTTALPAPTLAVAVEPAVAVLPTPANAPAEPPPPTCVVQRRDSLWVLAERHLGDGLRWREIYDLNRGLPQPGGRTLDNPNLIIPGWSLTLPADAVGPAPPAAPDTAAAPIPAPAAPAPPPPTVAPEPVAPNPTTAATPTTQSGRSDGEPSVAEDDPADDRFPVPLPLAGATLLAAGLVAIIDGRRRRQLHRRASGRLIPMPSPAGQDAERLLRAAAATQPANRLDLALRLLAHQIATSADSRSTRIEAVRVDGDDIEILLTSAVAAEPGPFDVVDGRVWTLPAGADAAALTDTASRVTAPAPALVTIGHLECCQVLVDLEAGPLAIVGDAANATAVLWSITAELATSCWADDIRIVVIGEPPAGLHGLDRVESYASIDAVADELWHSTEAMRRALGDLDQDSAWSARLSAVGDAWTPTLVLVSPDASGEVDPSLTAGVVRCADTPRPEERVLRMEPDRCVLEPLGLSLSLPGLPEDLIQPTAEVLDVAASNEPGPVLDLREHQPACYVMPTKTPAGEEQVEDESDPDRVLVRILGPVRIEGAKNPIQRRRIKELIVYLSLHPEGVTDEQIMAALWPGDTPTRSAFNQTVSRARAALGYDADGEPIIPFVDHSLYRPSRHLVCDALLLERAFANGASVDGITISGDPFAGSAGFDWAYVEGQAYWAAVLIEKAREPARLGGSRP